MRKAYMACDPRTTRPQSEFVRSIAANDEDSFARIGPQSTLDQIESRISSLRLSLSLGIRSEIRDQIYRMNNSATHTEESTVRVVPRPTDDRSPITFLTLPQEIRDQIYREVFSNLAIRYQKQPSNQWSCFPWLEDAEGKWCLLPMLRVCQRINREVGLTWMRYVTWTFPDPVVLLDLLTPQPQHKLSLIRKLAIDAGKLPLLTTAGCIHFNINAVLKFLQVLNLDLLVIRDWSASDWRKAFHMYHLIDDLVKAGSGWKELCVISNSCMGLGTRRSPRSIRNAQPSYWQAVLDVRGDQGAYVDISQRKKPGGPFEPLSREVARIWDMKDFKDVESISYDTLESFLRSLDRETMVVVRRGDNADISGQGRGRLEVFENPKQDIGRWFPGKSWEEIRPAFRG